MTTILAKALLLVEVWLASVYFFSYAITASRVLEVALAIMVFILGYGKQPLRPSTIRLLTTAFALIFFKFVVDFGFQFQNFADPINKALTELFVVVTLASFERIGWREIRIPKWIVAAAVLPAILGLGQILAGGVFVLKNVVPQNPIIIFSQLRDSYLEDTGRIVGTFEIGVGFAFYLGLVFLVLFSFLLRSRFSGKVSILLGLLIVSVLILSTQTRSAIYGLFPTLILAYFLAAPKSARTIIVAVLSVSALVLSVGIFESFVTQYSERSVLGIDSITYRKITANVYGVYAALNRNLWIGIPVNRRLDQGGAEMEDQELLREGERLLHWELEVDETFSLAATNHNIFAFYLKYYGLIGAALFVLVIYAMLLKCKRKSDFSDRFMAYSVIVFYVQYSLLHNTQILEVLLVWLLIAHGEEYA